MENYIRQLQEKQLEETRRVNSLKQEKQALIAQVYTTGQLYTNANQIRLPSSKHLCAHLYDHAPALVGGAMLFGMRWANHPFVM
jgi:hypothetical protein